MRPKLRLPSRDYLLLAGPLEAARQIGYWHGPAWFVASLRTDDSLAYDADRFNPVR